MLWSPAFFGVKPELVLKGGIIAAAPMGDPNASIPTPQPVHYRPMFGAFGRSLAASAVTFVSKAAAVVAISRRELGLARPLVAGENTRGGIAQGDMVHNDATPHIEVDPETYEVRADGELLTCEPPRCCRWRSAISCSDMQRAERIERGGQLAAGRRARHASRWPMTTGIAGALRLATDAGETFPARSAARGGARGGRRACALGRRLDSCVEAAPERCSRSPRGAPSCWPGSPGISATAISRRRSRGSHPDPRRPCHRRHARRARRALRTSRRRSTRSAAPITPATSTARHDHHAMARRMHHDRIERARSIA